MTHLTIPVAGALAAKAVETNIIVTLLFGGHFVAGALAAKAVET